MNITLDLRSVKNSLFWQCTICGIKAIVQFREEPMFYGQQDKNTCIPKNTGLGTGPSTDRQLMHEGQYYDQVFGAEYAIQTPHVKHPIAVHAEIKMRGALKAMAQSKEYVPVLFEESWKPDPLNRPGFKVLRINLFCHEIDFVQP